MLDCGALRCARRSVFLDDEVGGELEIPVSWYVISHPKGTVIVDGGNPPQVVDDPLGHWGEVAHDFWPVMSLDELCLPQLVKLGRSTAPSSSRSTRPKRSSTGTRALSRAPWSRRARRSGRSRSSGASPLVRARGPCRATIRSPGRRSGRRPTSTAERWVGGGPGRPGRRERPSGGAAPPRRAPPRGSRSV
jgi:hypothetical protein